jgi:hypothetical protein
MLLHAGQNVFIQSKPLRTRTRSYQHGAGLNAAQIFDVHAIGGTPNTNNRRPELPNFKAVDWDITATTALVLLPGVCATDAVASSPIPTLSFPIQIALPFQLVGDLARIVFRDLLNTTNTKTLLVLRLPHTIQYLVLYRQIRCCAL